MSWEMRNGNMVWNPPQPISISAITNFRAMLKIKKVIFNPPATIVLWDDGTKTVVKCQNEAFDREKGLAMAVAKKALGNRSNFNNEFKKWIDEDDEYDKGNCAKTYSMLDALDRIAKLFGDKQ